jgi:ubiquinone/menaquinone biosynthesis C-methylase UbiE
LRKAGLQGWGGKDFTRRQNGWVKTLADFQKDGCFPKAPARALELGCGNGMASFLMAQQGYKVFGVDLAPEGINWARERFAQARLSGQFCEGDVCSMPWFEDSLFDAVIDGNCLHCIIGADRVRCLGEVRRVLRPGGVFLLSSMCGTPKSAEVHERFDYVKQCLLEDGRPYRTLEPAEEIIAEVQDAGFRVYRKVVSIRPWWNHLNLLCSR